MRHVEAAQDVKGHLSVSHCFEMKIKKTYEYKLG